MARDVPTGGLTYEPPSWDVARVRGNEERTADRYLAVVSLARARDGSPAGYTLVYPDRGDPDHVRQDDTLVLTGHRGRGVGTALKTANLRELDEHRDSRRLLHTWTARSNTAMRAVNTRLGFRAVESVHEYERTDP